MKTWEMLFIRANSGNLDRCPAYSLRDNAEIVVNRMQNYWNGQTGKNWGLSHRHTGLVIHAHWVFRTRKAALAFADSLEDIPAWRQLPRSACKPSGFNMSAVELQTLSDEVRRRYEALTADVVTEQDSEQAK